MDLHPRADRWVADSPRVQILPPQPIQRPPGEIRGGFLIWGTWMGRLKAMPSRIPPMPNRFGSPLPDERSRDVGLTGRRQLGREMYDTRRWRKLRHEVFARDLFTCQMCGRLEGDTSKLVADHRIPHMGMADRFFDKSNLWTLCASPCHNKIKQAEETAAKMRGEY